MKDFDTNTQYIDWIQSILDTPSIPIEVMNGLGNKSVYYIDSTTYEEMLSLFREGAWFLFDIKNNI